MSHLNLVQPWAAHLSVFTSSVSGLGIGHCKLTALIKLIRQKINY